MSDQHSPVPGWYPDVEVPGGERYWDGHAWTDHRRAGPTQSTPWGSQPVVRDEGGSGPAAGWYPDPEVPGGQRYWDGSQWGEQRPPAGGPSWQQQPPSAPGWQAAGGYTPVVDVDPWLWQSILSAVLCCPPLGIVAILKSSQARSALDMGAGAEAKQRADEARTWTLLAVAVALVVYLLFFGLTVATG